MAQQFDQKLFFKLFKQSLPPHKKLVAVLSEVLGLDISNAYRRLRCQKELTLNEFFQIAERYPEARRIMAKVVHEDHIDVSMSQFENLEGFKGYLRNTISNLSKALNLEHTLYYMARDLPLFFYFSQPDLFRFKLAVWFYSGNIPLEEPDAETFRLGKELFALYQKLNTVEIWYENGFLNQIEQLQCWQDMEYLNLADVNQVCQAMIESFKNYEQWLEQGVKPGGGSLEIHQSGFSIMSDGGLLQCSDHKQTFARIQGIHQLHSTHPNFIELFEKHWGAHHKLAIPLMNSNTRHRRLFFKRIQENLEQFEAR